MLSSNGSPFSGNLPRDLQLSGDCVRVTYFIPGAKKFSDFIGSLLWSHAKYNTLKQPVSSIDITDMTIVNLGFLYCPMFASITHVTTITHVQHITGMLLFIY